MVSEGSKGTEPTAGILDGTGLVVTSITLLNASACPTP
jgi:hypothetical protein